MATRIAGTSSGKVTWRNSLQWRRAIHPRGLIQLVGNGQPRRVQDDEGERQVQPDRQQGDHQQSVRWHERPVQDRQAERLQRGGHRPDIRVEQEAPHHHRRHLADRVGRQHGHEQQAAQRQARWRTAAPCRGRATSSTCTTISDDDDRVAQRAPEIGIAERMYVIGEPDEAGRLAERGRRETQPDDVERRDHDHAEHQHVHRRDERQRFHWDAETAVAGPMRRDGACQRARSCCCHAGGGFVLRGLSRRDPLRGSHRPSCRCDSAGAACGT